MEQAIQDFLDERKAGWLKGKLKPHLSDDEQAAIKAEAELKYSLPNWLPDAAKRAGQLNLATHPGKFSHPNAKTSMILATSEMARDGLLRSGNLVVEPDVLGNAAALDVFKFLSVVLSDGQSILWHLQQGSSLIKKEFEMETASFEELSKGLLSIQKQESQQLTHERVKQVYFPIGNGEATQGDYHLLSVLTPSGILFDMRERIQDMRFSETTKAAREAQRTQSYHPEGYQELYGLAMIGYGGTKPQNISVLNSQNGGKAYLLPSLPPRLEKRNLRLPRRNFFAECLWFKAFQSSFIYLHKLFVDEKNNLDIRQKRDHLLLSILDQVLFKVWELRAFSQSSHGHAWSQSEHYADLPLAQKIWLDDSYLEQRQSQDEWLQEILKGFLSWLVYAYERNTHGSDPQILLSDDELKAFKHEVFLPHLEDLR